MNRPGMGQNGSVLVVTLGAILVLLVLAVQVARLTGGSAMQTMVEKEKLAANELAMSAVHLAMFMLAQDASQNDIDSVQEEWADPDIIKQGLDLLEADNIEVKLRIIDELGKIQLNALMSQFPGNEINVDQYNILERFFTLILQDRELEEEATGPVEMLNALKDWMDSGDDEAITGLSGAESDYYQGLDSPYFCTNGPLRHLDELFKIKSINREVLADDFSDEHAGDESAHFKLEPGDVLSVFGLSDKKTDSDRYAFPGRININTAPVQVIAAMLPEGREHQAQDLVDFRVARPAPEDEYTNSLGKGWYKDVIELSDKEKKKLERKIIYSSNLFRADCFVKTESYHFGLSAVIKREKHKETGKWICRILQLEGV